MKFLYALLFVAVVVFAQDDDGKFIDFILLQLPKKKYLKFIDHSNHCHIDGYPTIHVNIGDHIDLPGACLRLLCKTTDLFEAVNT